MLNVLNQRLYRNLERRFGKISITNLGSRTRVIYRPDHYFRKGKLKPEVIEYGETYRVNCPFCTDTRQRLYINHLWAERDEETNDDMLHLAKCFNDECLATRKMQKELHAQIYPNGKFGRSIVPYPSVAQIESPPPLSPVNLPASVPLTELSRSHPAISYLRKRGFDAELLADAWAISYCEYNTCERPAFADTRLLIPIMLPHLNPFAAGLDTELRLVGWQARMLKPSTSRPKYLTSRGMKKNCVLYGLNEAKQADGPVVIMEGVTDVWRYGAGAVALFGKTISKVQVELLRRHLPGRPIVVLLDRDAAEEARKLREAIIIDRRQYGDLTPVRLGNLPAGRNDPGECTLAELRGATTLST